MHRVKPETSAAVYRAMIAVACVLACVTAMQVLQFLFDRGDLRRALGVVRDFRGPEGRSIEEELRLRHADDILGDPSWDATIVSGCYGVVRATATVARQKRSPAVYRWDVDLVNGSIHPADDAGRELLMVMQVGNTSPRAPVAPDE